MGEQAPEEENEQVEEQADEVEPETQQDEEETDEDLFTNEQAQPALEHLKRAAEVDGNDVTVLQMAADYVEDEDPELASLLRKKCSQEALALQIMRERKQRDELAEWLRQTVVRTLRAEDNKVSRVVDVQLSPHKKSRCIIMAFKWCCERWRVWMEVKSGHIKASKRVTGGWNEGDSVAIIIGALLNHVIAESGRFPKDNEEEDGERDTNQQ